MVSIILFNIYIFFSSLSFSLFTGRCTVGMWVLKTLCPVYSPSSSALISLEREIGECAFSYF